MSNIASFSSPPPLKFLASTHQEGVVRHVMVVEIFIELVFFRFPDDEGAIEPLPPQQPCKGTE